MAAALAATYNTPPALGRRPSGVAESGDLRLDATMLVASDHSKLIVIHCVPAPAVG
jgi:hypothetical protein